MKKIICMILLSFSVVSFSTENTLGIIGDKELREVGVKESNIKKAKDLMNEVASSYKLKVLEKEELQLQINKYLLDGAEKNLSKIDRIFEKIGQIEVSIMKERMRSQIKMQKYITQDQYMKARELSIKRLNSGR
ncbi:MAG: hypothetical protein KGV57_03840 [Fusobacterium sp.]|nr:hypothetical protein [Fusobacterium sp.]